MKLALTTMTAGLLISSAAQAQSVAQSIETLTAKVAGLESRSSSAGPSQGGSPLVESTGQKDGGWLRILDQQKHERINLWADGKGGVFSIVSSDGKTVANLSTGAFLPEGILSLCDGLGSKRTVQLDGLSGLTIYDSGGTNAVASFGRTLLGAGAQVTVNGIKVHDYAEVFDLFDCRDLAPGMVVSESADGRGIQLSSEPYDPAAVGVISGAGSFEPGMRIGSRVDGSTDNPVAVAGQVYVWVNSESGAISVGDLLVNSSEPGVAMRGADSSRLIGTVIGKALEPYSAKGLRKNNHSSGVVVATLSRKPMPCHSLRGNRQPQY